MPAEAGFVDGFPVGPLEAIGLLLVIWIAAHRVRIAGGWLAATLAAAALAAGLAVPGERGLHARYFAGDTVAGAHERSTDFDDPDFTRIDARLDFSRGTHDFPLAFFNDHTRFNFMRLGEPDRRYLAFAAAWTGWLWTPAGAHTFYLHAPGASAQLSIDAAPLAATGPDGGDATRDLALAEGWHRLHVTLSSPYGGPREFSAGELRDGRRHPFGVATTRTERIDNRQMAVARVLAIAKPLVDLVALGYLGIIALLILVRRAGEVWQRRAAAGPAAMSLFMAAASIEALRVAWPWADRLRIMAPGDDPMVYEGYARDILFRGILMNGGLPLGQGEPFYYQAFYPYFLAATHAVFGEAFFGTLLVQRLLVAVTAVALTRAAMIIHGNRVWPAALLVSTAFLYWKLAPISADMLSESLYVPLLAMWVTATLALCRETDARRATRSGLLGGITAITRSTALLSLVVVWLATLVHLRGWPRRARILAVVAGCSLAVFSLIAVRNALVSHRFVPTSTEFGITLRGGNEPPGDLVLDTTPRKWLYDALKVGGYTAEVIEYAIRAPGPFARNLARKAVFVLGIYEPYAPGWGYSPVYLAVWISAVAGLVLLLRTRPLPALALIPAIVAVTQYVAIVLVYPKGERLIVPIHTMLVPYASIAAYALLTRVTGGGHRAEPAAPTTPP